MSRSETRPGTVGATGFDRNTGVALNGRSLEQPTAGVVHDLGNLIQVASSALNRVARDPSVSAAPTLEPVITSAKAALQRAGALVRETISRAQESHREIEHTNVSACLAEVEILIRSAWDPNIRLEVCVGSNLPSARCDHLGLQNAVLNLVFNARDAMPDGGSISICATALVEGLVTLVELRIEDGGIGMTKETMVRAFDPFFTTKGKGLGGVGLPMVKRFAEQHGGSVEIESILGSGTTVIMRLPAVRSEIDVRQLDQPASSFGQSRSRQAAIASADTDLQVKSAYTGEFEMHETVKENTQQHRFELPIADEAFAAAYYRLENGRVVLIHTEVPAEFSGQGIASRLAHGTFDLLRKTGRTAVLKCPFMSRFIVKNPKYADIVAG